MSTSVSNTDAQKPAKRLSAGMIAGMVVAAVAILALTFWIIATLINTISDSAASPEEDAMDGVQTSIMAPDTGVPIDPRDTDEMFTPDGADAIANTIDDDAAGTADTDDVNVVYVTETVVAQ